MYKPIKSTILLVGTVLLFSFTGHQSQAAEYSVLAGPAFATQPFPTYGLAVSANARMPLPWGPTHSEFQYITQYLSGSGRINRRQSADVSVILKNFELNWFVLYETVDQWYIGPGVGYGFLFVYEDVETDGGNRLGDPSPLFDSENIHIGSLMVKAARSWERVHCEGRLSSFGGLIGGGVLCGILF